MTIINIIAAMFGLLVFSRLEKKKKTLAILSNNTATMCTDNNYYFTIANSCKQTTFDLSNLGFTGHGHSV